MASYEKLVKYLVERFQLALSPLTEIVRNQGIIINQNKRMHELLENIHSTRLTKPEEQNTDSSRPIGESDYVIDFDNIPEADDQEEM